MRPRRQIILLAEHEDKTSEIRFLLDTHMFSVRASVSPDGMEATESTRAILIEYSMLKSLDRLTAGRVIPTVIFGLSHIDYDHSDKFFVFDGADWAARLVDTLRLATARKRGPKKSNIPPIHKRHGRVADYPHLPASTIPACSVASSL